MDLGVTPRSCGTKTEEAFDIGMAVNGSGKKRVGVTEPIGITLIGVVLIGLSKGNRPDKKVMRQRPQKSLTKNTTNFTSQSQKPARTPPRRRTFPQKEKSASKLCFTCQRQLLGISTPTTAANSKNL